MSERHRGNTNPSGQRNSNVQNETSSRNTSRFKWTYEQEKTLIELYDQAISMSDYTLKDPTFLGLNILFGFKKSETDLKYMFGSILVVTKVLIGYFWTWILVWVHILPKIRSDTQSTNIF
ncbi:hypothetical protein Bca52824_023936 [Brassica carinata]|uniref:Uncharacterized protein n=1 Tax=Brassica carinata TaxID=52824 RepID=A0A8X7VJI1_BRACI|nr:hypothetical protein Bca52824_023936 [Brassica carinata]